MLPPSMLDRNACGSTPSAWGRAPERLGEGDRLADVLDHAEDPVVEDQLEPRGGAGFVSEPHRLAPDGVEHRVGGLTQLWRTGGEDDELRLLGRLLGAEHGRVDVAHPAL